MTKPEDLARAEGWLCVIKKVAEGMGEEEFFKSPQDWIDKYKLPVQLDFKFLNKMCPEWIAEIDRTIQVRGLLQDDSCVETRQQSEMTRAKRAPPRSPEFLPRLVDRLGDQVFR